MAPGHPTVFVPPTTWEVNLVKGAPGDPEPAPSTMDIHGPHFNKNTPEVAKKEGGSHYHGVVLRLVMWCVRRDLAPTS